MLAKGTTTRSTSEKRKKQLAAPVRPDDRAGPRGPSPTPKPQPLSPPGYAQDLPSSSPVSMGARGGELLSRGSPYRALEAPLNAHEQHALAVLHNPKHLYDPNNASVVNTLLRPRPALQSVIQGDPVASHNHAALIDHITARGNDPLPEQQQYDPRTHPLLAQREKDAHIFRTSYPPGSGLYEQAQLHADDAQHQLQTLVNTRGGPDQAEKFLHDQAVSAQEGIFPFPAQIAVSGARTAIGIGPGLVQLAKGEATNPIGTTEALGKNIYESYKGDVQHPGHALETDPFGLALNAIGVGGAAGAIAGRVAAVGDAARGAEAARALQVPDEVNHARVANHLRESFGTNDPNRVGEVFGNFEDIKNAVKQKAGAPLDQLAQKRLEVKGPQPLWSGRGPDDFGDMIHETATELTGNPNWDENPAVFDRVQAAAENVPEGSDMKDFVKAIHNALQEPAARAGKTKAVLKAAVKRPAPVVRSLTYNGVTVPVPAFKNYAFGKLQQMMDKGTQFRLDHPQMDLPKLMGGRLSAQAKFARQLRAHRMVETDVAQGPLHFPVSHRMGPTAPAKLVGGIKSRLSGGPSALDELGPTPTRDDLKTLAKQYGLPHNKSKQQLIDSLSTTPSTKGLSGVRQAVAGVLPDRTALIPRASQAGRITAAAQQAVSPEVNNLVALQRLTGAHDLHQLMYSMAHDKPEDYAGKTVAIKPPPSNPTFDASKGASDNALYERFRRAFEHDPSRIAQNPDNYKYLPKEIRDVLMPYHPNEYFGKAGEQLDRLNQLVRAGRFLHPGYLQWAVQNGVIHLSQAGMYAFRNAYRLHKEYPKLIQKNPEAAGAMERAMGSGIARSTVGESKTLRTSVAKLGEFWHGVDDRVPRLMSLIHEMSHAGYHTADDWAKLFTDPQLAHERSTIVQQAKDEAIDYSAMTPAERGTFKKIFTAWGWTRGATQFAGRFPFQHPGQAVALGAVGRQGADQVDQYYNKLGGMVPAWLASDLPGKGAHPHMTETGFLNPFETPARLAESSPGFPHATESLLGEFAPIPGLAQEWLSGRNQYGTRLQNRGLDPLVHLAKRFEPVGAIASLTKKSGSEIGGPRATIERYAGIPQIQLRDPKKSAELGMKDYESTLSREEQIHFRHDQSMSKLPQEIAQFQAKTGSPPSPALISKLRGDYDAVQQRDLFQHQWAKGHNSKTWRALPAITKLQGTVQFMQDHKMLHNHQAHAILDQASRLNDDKQIEDITSQLWSDTAIGSVASSWKTAVSEVKPPVLTPGS